MRNKNLFRDTLTALSIHFNSPIMAVQDWEDVFCKSSSIHTVTETVADVDECQVVLYENGNDIATGILRIVNDDGAIYINDMSYSFYEYLDEIGIMDRWDDVL